MLKKRSYIYISLSLRLWIIAGSTTRIIVYIRQTKTRYISYKPLPSLLLLSSVFYSLIYNYNKALEPYLKRKYISKEGDFIILKLAN
jgi:hypothetical protein